MFLKVMTAVGSVSRLSSVASRLQEALAGLAGAVTLAAAYELIHASGLVDPRTLPSAFSVLVQLISVFSDSDFLLAAIDTAAPALSGLALGVAIAVPLGVLLGRCPPCSEAASGTIDILRSLPATALIPVLIFTLGQGFVMKVVLVIYVACWPILLNAMYGARSIDPRTIESALSCRVRGVALWLTVVLPSCGPAIFSGIRYALPVSVVVVIAAEIALGSAEGMGGYLLQQQYSSSYRPDRVFAILLAAGLVAYALNLAGNSLATYFVGWETSRGERQ